MDRRSILSILVSLGWLAAGWAAEPLKLVSADVEARYRATLPKAVGEPLRTILASRWVVWYNTDVMPPAYQDWSNVSSGAHSPFYNVSATKPFERFGNANREFPWGHTVGIDDCDPRMTGRFLFFLLPPADEREPDGDRAPVVYWQNPEGGYSWTFPVGTVFGEVLWLNGAPDRRSRTFEIRTRTRRADTWVPNVYRPYPTARSLAVAVKQRRPDWYRADDLTALVRHLEQPLAGSVDVVVNRHPTPIVQGQARLDVLPPIEPAVVSELLDTAAYTSAVAAAWRDQPGDPEAPTTEADYHIVPAKYRAHFIAVNTASCMQCHNTTNQRAQALEFPRDWYGNVRGSDGVFSFQPFADAAIADNGFPRPVAFRADLVRAGWWVRFDPQRHTAPRYQRIRGVW